jgi:uncharacterized caspase-like protein
MLRERITFVMRARVALLLIGFFVSALGIADVERSKFSGIAIIPPKRWAIVIGAQEYENYGKLRCTVRDAKGFANLLVDQLKFQPDAIKLITDDKDSTLKPNAATIKTALDEELADKRLDKGDLFIFYFSGHGIGTPKGDFLLPTDATKANAEQVGLQAKEIVEAFVKAGLRNVLIIADACRSGEQNQFGEELKRLGKEANIAVFLGCEPGKRSYEYPQLGHGAFTNFLLRAFEDKSLLDPTTGGALWASKVGASVQAQVHTYTERDYPESPQVPSLQSEPRLDILLGLYPEDAESHLTKFVEQASKKLDPEKFQIALVDYANRMYCEDRLKEAIGAFKTAESAFHLNPADKFVLALACEQAGRTAESQIYFKQLARDGEYLYFRSLAIMFNPSREIPPKERVEAARALWKADPRDPTALFAYCAVQMYGSTDDLKSVLSEMLRQGSLQPRLGLMFKGYIDGANNDWKSAAAKFEAALKAEGEYPTLDTLVVSVLAAKIRLGDTATLAEFIQTQAQRSPGKEGEWLLLLASYKLEQGKKEEALALVKLALKSDLDPGQLLDCIRMSGLHYLEIGEAVKRQALRNPDSWKSSLALFWVTKLGKPDAFDALQKVMDSNLLTDDPFLILFEAYKILDAQLGEVFDLGRIEPMKYLVLMGDYASDMIHNVDKFGYDFEPWTYLIKFALLSEKYEQVKLLFDRKLGPRLEDGTLTIYLRAQYLFAAINTGDTVRAEKLWNMKGFHPSDVIDGGWMMAMAKATRGEPVSVADLPKAMPSTSYVGPAKAFLAYLKGGTAELEALQKQYPTDQGTMQWIALAYVKQGNWNRALPILKTFYTQRAITLTFLQAKVSQVYFDQLIASKKFDLANDVAFNMMISAFGNPLYSKIHFGPKSDISQYAGHTEFDVAEFEIPEDMRHGEMTMTTDADGRISGRLVIEKTTYDVQGTTDAYGNVHATVKNPMKLWNMTGKIPPPALYKTMARFAQAGQTFMLLEPNGQGTYLIMRIKS